MSGGACKVFLVGEGPADIGDLAHDPSWREDPPKEGFFQPLLRTLTGLELQFEGRTIKQLPSSPLRSAAKGQARRARQALILAAVEEADALVFTHDVDREGGRRAGARERARRMAEMREQAEAGFEEAREDEPSARSLPALVATPCRMVEAWALGDAQALDSVGGDRRQVPARPEELWGDKHDPASDYPKHRLARVLGRRPSTQILADIAAAVRVAVLRRSCPESFAPFADAVRAAGRRCRRRPPR